MGTDPTGYHWVNLLLHVANALLVWLVLARLRVPGAWLAGAIFALHPVQVESVAWITERKNVLMGFFFLLTLLAWIAFVDGRTKRPWLFYGLALVLYLLALSAKTTACTLPAAFVFDSVVAEKADQFETNYPDHSFPCSWHRHGRISDVVGALPSGDEPCCFYVPEPNRTGSCREPRRLVLSE